MKCIKPVPVQKGRVVMKVPCGQCIACRINKKEEWALRMEHELRGHRGSCFFTLTYDPKVYNGESLVKRDLQLFIKRLRKEVKDHGIRYYAVGEYGGRFGRPHYHGIVFGLGLAEKSHVASCWGKGFVMVGEANALTIRYVAKYIQKKAMGDYKKEMINQGLEPEFSIMSLKPGIGYNFAQKYISNWREIGFVVQKGIKRKIPRYYLNSGLDEMQRKEFAQRKIEEKKMLLDRKVANGKLSETEVIIKEQSENGQREKNQLKKLEMRESK